jgi:DeoR/GlpR family transcriptional regulator of sugar metabolism
MAEARRSGDRSVPRGMLGAERLARIHRKLIEHGRILVAEEAKLFAVSDETIRRDIKALAESGVAEAVFGGAVIRRANGLAALGILPVNEREKIEHEAKNAIGALVADHVQNGQVIILDAGTTTLAIAHHLRRHSDLTIVTNSLPVAQVGAGFPRGSIHVLGGKLIPRSMSLVGPQAARELAGLKADWAFLGTQAIDARAGFSSADTYEAQVKRAMIQAARRIAVVADHTKLERSGFAIFAAPADVDDLFTSAKIPKTLARRFEKAGVTVHIASAKDA